jgi:hypothetical protein
MYQGQPGAAAVSRSLSAAELHRVIEHLLDTEMAVPDALHALRLGLDVATMEDVETIMQHLARCAECRTWTRLGDLRQGVCPACRAEACAPDAAGVCEDLKEN